MPSYTRHDALRDLWTSLLIALTTILLCAVIVLAAEVMRR